MAIRVVKMKGAMKTKQKKLIVFALIMSLLFFFGGVAGAIVANNVERLSEENTTEIKATVKKAELIRSEEDESIKVITEEYGDKLCILAMNEIIDMTGIANLQVNQTVYFRIEDIWLDQFEEMEFIYIVSLRTAEKEIFSLSNFNAYMELQHSKITITCLVLGPMCLLVSIHCILLLKGVNVFRKQKK